MSAVASERVMYHVTMANRASLLRHGLDWRRCPIRVGEGYEDLPRGNYLWPTLASAYAWAEYGEFPYILRVDVSGIRLKRDPYWDNLDETDIDYAMFVGPRGGAPRAFYSEQPISPERLELIDVVSFRHSIKLAA